MKLSASSRAYVAEQVRRGFAEELRAADKAVEDAEKAKNAPYEALEEDLEKLSPAWMGEFERLMEKHGLHWNRGKGPADGACVKVFDGDGPYDRIDYMSFAETCDSTEIDKAKEACDGVRDRIEKAVQKALFEVEVHGKKDTLQKIVEQVIREIKEGK